MSAQAQVSAPAGDEDRAPEGLRVRPPSPLPPRRRAVIAGVVVALVLVGAVLVLRARSSDGDQLPGGAWRGIPVPRAAHVDAFDQAGPLGAVDGFGSWQTGSGSLQVADGRLRSTGAEAVATVDAGSSDVLVHAQVVQFEADAGLVLSASADGSEGLRLVATGGDEGWELRWYRGTEGPQVIEAFPAPHAGVSVQATRQDDRVRVAFDDLAYEVGVPPESAGGTFVGVAAAAPGNELDLFGYLPIDAG